LRIPRTLGGNNLIIPGATRDILPFRSCFADFRKCGMISLDRKRYKKDKQYKQAFNSYMEYFLKHDCSDLMFFPEGGRSYDGSLKELKKGILSQVYAAQQESYRDYAIMPVSISWERVAEDAHFRRQKRIKGLKNIMFQKLAFAVDIANLVRYMRKEPKGQVHIDFGEPILVANESVDSMGDGIYSQLSGMAKVTPTSLVAACFRPTGQGSPSISFSKMTGDIKKKLDTLPDTVPVSASITGRSVEDIAERGIMFLSEGRKQPGLVLSDGKYVVKNGLIVDYYINAAKHIF
jgi:glycerol-3-phosphate O-acyltransferase